MPELEYRGNWWLESNTDDEVPGVLTFDQKKGGELELFDSFDDIPDFESVTGKVIHGNVIEGEQITLLGCNIHTAGGQLGSVNIMTQSAIPQTILTGGHFGESPEFDSLVLDLPLLEELTSQRSVDITFGEDEGGNMNPRDIKTEIREVDPLESVVDGVTIKYQIGTNLSFNNDRGIEYSQLTAIIIDSPLSLEEYQHYIWHIRGLVSLALGELVYPNKIEGRIKRKAPDKWGIEEDYINHKVQVYQQYPHYREASDSIHPNHLSFTFEDVGFVTAIQNWFQHAEDAKMLYELYFSTITDSDMYVKYKFLSLIISLEAYFNSTHSTRRIESDEFSKIVDIVVQAIPDDSPVKKRVTDVVESLGYRYSLTEKLETVVEDHKNVLSELLNTHEVVRDARDTRHALAHGSSSGNNRAKTEIQELVPLMRALKLIVEVCLLDEIGVSNDRVIEHMQRNYGKSIGEYKEFDTEDI